MTAFFFDMDGTLIDSRADLVETVNATRRDLGLAEISPDAVMACVGNGMHALLHKAIPEAEDRFEEVLPIHRRNYERHMLDHVALYPGLADALRFLAGRGCPLGIVTNKPNFATHAILKHLGVFDLFADAIVAGGDGVALKPAADPLVASAARLRHALAPDDWMVGDNWTDVDCGVAAGVRTAFCRYGYGRVGDNAPTVCVDDLAAFLTKAL